jgi:diguanylate cyclase (GGDEF)-like protein/PAS domain S-box-containing protein
MARTNKAAYDAGSLTIHKKSTAPNGAHRERAARGEPSNGNAEELLRLKLQAIESTRRGLLISDRQGKILWANQAMRQLTGYAPEEIVGKTPSLFHSGRQSPDFYKQLWETILSGNEWQGDLVNRRKDGSLYIEQMSITPVRDGMGEISHFISVKQDVTAERREQERTRLLARAVESSSEMIGANDAEGQLTYLNPALLKALGREEKELLGQPFTVMFSRNNPASLIDEISKKTLRDEGWSGECLFAGPDGKDLPIEGSLSAIRDDAGLVVGSLGIGRDIGQRKMAEEKLRESEELFRQLAENIREVFFASTPEPSQVVYVSPAYEEIWGRPRQEVYERPGAWIDAIHSEDRARVADVFLQSQQGLKTDIEYRVVRPDGAIRWIRNRTFPVHNDQGRFVRVVGLAEDITDQKAMTAELREARAVLHQTLEETQLQVRVSEKLTQFIDLVQCSETDQEAYKIAEDSLGSIFESHEGALCLTGPSRKNVEMVAAWGRDPDTERSFAPGDCWALRRGKLHVAKGDSPLRCPHVKESLHGGHLCIPLMAQGETLGLLYLQRRMEASMGPEDVEQDLEAIARRAEQVGDRVSLVLANLKLREVLRQQSVRDPLTGIFNRRYMEETLSRELNRACRNNETVAVAMCDLDHFKDFNDRFGHETGDLVLREVASVLKLKVRQGDIACRYGGEEFVVILPGATAEAALERAEIIRKQVESLNISGTEPTVGKVTLSIGIAVYPACGADGEEIIRTADLALYQAKAAGRNRVALARKAPSS